MALRYTKIPFTVVFAEGRLATNRLSQIDSRLATHRKFFENIDFSSRLSDFRARLQHLALAMDLAHHALSPL